MLNTFGRVSRLLAVYVLLASVACINSCGPRTVVIETIKNDQQAQDNLPPDDTLASKNPQYTDFMATLQGGAYVNRSASVLSLRIDAPQGDSALAASEKIYPTFTAALSAPASSSTLPSLDMIDRYTKATDDLAYASVEHALHKGSEIYPGGKQALLSDLLAALAAAPQSSQRDLAQAFIAVAIRLGGGTAELAGAAETLAATIEGQFEANPMISKPLGFYDEDETLRMVFRRDRLLQQAFGMAEAGVPTFTGQSSDTELLAMALIAETLEADAAMLEAYSRYQQVAERITNPTSNLDLRDVLPFDAHFANAAALRTAILGSDAWAEKIEGLNASNGNNAGVAFWPFSYSKENVLFRKIPPNEAAGTNLMDMLVDAIRSGEVVLEPANNSGWYDYQVFALETLLLPERAEENNNLLLSGTYKQRLKKAFEALITQRRETHIKQLETGFGSTSAPPPPPSPQLSVEPLATNYLRTARAYRMLLDGLGPLLGGGFGAVALSDGSGTVEDRLEQSCILFYGLYLTVCNEIGVTPSLAPDELEKCKALSPGDIPQEIRLAFGVAMDPAISAEEANRRVAAAMWASQWLQTLSGDAVLAVDPRVIVPVFFDPVENKLRCWAVLGVKLISLEMEYAVPPKLVSSYGGAGLIPREQAISQLAAGTGLMTMAWEPRSVTLPVYEFAEVKIDPVPMTREEFRAICDQGSTKQQIVDLLQGSS